MKRILKRIGIGLGALLVVLLLVAAGLYVRGRMAFNRRVEVAAKPLALRSDPATLARGRHLAEAVTGCTVCHTANFAGQPFVDSPVFATIAAPNLTAGRGGLGKRYTPEDWVRAIRHGVGADGRRLVIMPSQHFAELSDGDAAALVAYLRTVPPVDNVLPERRVGPMGGILLGAGQLTFPADAVARDREGSAAPAAPAPTPEYGRYLTTVALCAECHGEDLAGRKPGMGPPPGPNLTRGGRTGTWTEEAFIRTLRTGKAPDGYPLNPENMPWRQFARMSDVELQAIWRYLRSLPARGSPGQT